MSEGCFRFLCPLCNGYDTAVNPKTNLARCFRCEKNFNTIDLVMLVRQADFVHSVKFLQSIHQQDDQHHNCHEPAMLSGNNHQAKDQMKLKTPAAKPEKRPHAIGEILDDFLAHPHGGISKNRSVASKSYTPTVVGQITVEDRIVKLEQKLKFLDRQIKKIPRNLHVRLVSK